MKEKYQEPQMKLLELMTEEIVTTSGGLNNGGSGSGGTVDPNMQANTISVWGD